MILQSRGATLPTLSLSRSGGSTLHYITRHNSTLHFKVWRLYNVRLAPGGAIVYIRELLRHGADAGLLDARGRTATMLDSHALVPRGARRS